MLDLRSDSAVVSKLAATANARRNAKEMAAVYLEAVAAGSPDLEDVNDAETAALRIVFGVKGGQAGGFESTEFRVPLSEEELGIALQHVRWDAAGERLQYTP